MNSKPRYVDRRNPNDVYTIARVCDDMVWLKKEGNKILSNFQSCNLKDTLEHIDHELLQPTEQINEGG